MKHKGILDTLINKRCDEINLIHRLYDYINLMHYFKTKNEPKILIGFKAPLVFLKIFKRWSYKTRRSKKTLKRV